MKVRENIEENTEPRLLAEKTDEVGTTEKTSAATDETAGLSEDDLRASVEALLYAAEEPLSVKELAKALPEVERDAIKACLDELVESYQAPGRGLQIAHVAGGYQITTRPEHHDRISRLFSSKPPSRLSIQALETLAVIAYRQPITVPEIMALRGLHSAGVVRTLLEKKLIRIKGRKKVVGRPLLYGTTKEFEIRFGLRGLDDLPNLEDMAEVFGEEIAAQLGDVMQETEERGGTDTPPSMEGNTSPAPESSRHETPEDA